MPTHINTVPVESSSGSLPYVTVMVMLPSSFVYVGAVSAAGAAGAAVAGAAAFLVNLTSVSFVSPGLAYLTFPLAIAT
jgi:hypothetical protein